MKWNGGGGERQDQLNRAEGTVSPETALAEATTRNNKFGLEEWVDG